MNKQTKKGMKAVAVMLAVTLHCFFGCQDQWRQARQRFGQFQEGMLSGGEKHSQLEKDTVRKATKSQIFTQLFSS